MNRERNHVCFMYNVPYVGLVLLKQTYHFYYYRNSWNYNSQIHRKNRWANYLSECHERTHKEKERPCVPGDNTDCSVCFSDDVLPLLTHYPGRTSIPWNYLMLRVKTWHFIYELNKIHSIFWLGQCNCD